MDFDEKSTVRGLNEIHIPDEKAEGGREVSIDIDEGDVTVTGTADVGKTQDGEVIIDFDEIYWQGSPSQTGQSMSHTDSWNIDQSSAEEQNRLNEVWRNLGSEESEQLELTSAVRSEIERSIHIPVVSGIAVVTSIFGVIMATTGSLLVALPIIGISLFAFAVARKMLTKHDMEFSDVI